MIEINTQGCAKRRFKAYYLFLKNSGNRVLKKSKGAKRRINLCPPHEIILATPMVVMLLYTIYKATPKEWHTFCSIVCIYWKCFLSFFLVILSIEKK